MIRIGRVRFTDTTVSSKLSQEATMFEAKLKRNDVIDRSGAGDRPHPRVSTTLPNGEQLIIPTADASKQHDAKALGRSSARPKPE